MDFQLLTFDRLPLPSLEAYLTLSVLAASCSFYSIWKQNQDFSTRDLRGILNPYEQSNYYMNSTNFINLNERRIVEEDTGFFKGFIEIIGEWTSQQPHCIWPLVNLAYCFLIVLGYAVQKIVFGSLRASELENMRDQFWNLIFYKIVFIFGVVNVQEVEDAVGWCFFISLIGFLQLARQLSKERHNYLILINDWKNFRRGRAQRRRIIALLSMILVASVLLLLCVIGWYTNSFPIRSSLNSAQSTAAEASSLNSSQHPYSFSLGLHNAIFMCSETGLLIIQTLHALVICSLEQVKERGKRQRLSKYYRSSKLLPDEKIHTITHACNFGFELTALLFDLVHHVHMLVCCNLFLSMTSLIVSLQMRARARQIHAILKKRQSFIWLSKHVAKYPDLQQSTVDEDEDENCAICWENVTSHKAKILPCGHSFHTTCLKKWLVVSMSCPTCRYTLYDDEDENGLEDESASSVNNLNGSRRRGRGRRERRGRLRSRSSRQSQTPAVAHVDANDGFWGFLNTAQTLLDLFGGWDTQDDVLTSEVSSPPSNSMSLFGDFVVNDWTVQSSQPVVVSPTLPSSEASISDGK